MGYTHYWRFARPKNITAMELETQYQKAILECQKILCAWNKGAKTMDAHEERLSGYAAHCEPGTYAGVDINGAGDNGHEDFILREHFNQNRDFEFCKTIRKPYDTPVTACLALLKYRLKDAIDVSSDGEYEDWVSGVAFARDVIKRKIPNPIPSPENCPTCGHVISESHLKLA